MSDDKQDGIASDKARDGATNIPGVSTATSEAVRAAYNAYTRLRSLRGNWNVMPEPTEWLSKNFTVAQAYSDHQTRWFGPQDPEALKALGGMDHDVAHVILALTGARRYQADFEAEAHVFAMQAALSRPLAGLQTHEPSSLLTPEVYSDAIKIFSQGAKGQENLVRTLTWLVGGKTHQSMDAVYQAHGHDIVRLVSAAKELGITTSGEYIFGEWTVETSDRKRYSSNMGDPSAEVLPHGTNGVETFKPFDTPSEEAIRAVFDRVEPVLRDLHAQIHDISPRSVNGATLLDVLGDIPVTEIHARMNGGTTPVTIPPAALQRAQHAVLTNPPVPDDDLLPIYSLDNAKEIVPELPAVVMPNEKPSAVPRASSEATDAMIDEEFADLFRSAGEPVPQKKWVDTFSEVSADFDLHPETLKGPLHPQPQPASAAFDNAAEAVVPVNVSAYSVKDGRVLQAEFIGAQDVEHVSSGDVPSVHAVTGGEEAAHIRAGSVRAAHVRGGLIAAGIGAAVRGGMAFVHDADGATVAEQAGRGVMDAAIPGLGDGFSGITGSDEKRPVNWVDRSLNVLDTGTGAVATGSVVAAAGTEGVSLVPAAISGLANLGVNLLHDVTYAVGLSHEGGIITGGHNIIASVGDAMEAKEKHDNAKANVPQPVVEQFIVGMEQMRGDANNTALNNYFKVRDLAILENREGRVQSSTSLARFGHLPRYPISREEMLERIDDAARHYLATGGTLALAQGALDPNAGQVQSAMLIHNLINVVPAHDTKMQVYPTSDPQLEALRTLKQQLEQHPEQAQSLTAQMAIAAATYLNNGNTVANAVSSYYLSVPFTVDSSVAAQADKNPSLIQVYDGADGSKTDGHLSLKEIAVGMMKLGIHNHKADSDHSGNLSYDEWKTATNTPSEFQADKPSAGRKL